MAQRIAIGVEHWVCRLILRLIAARVILWNCERQAMVIWSSNQLAKKSGDPIVAALEDVCLQLGVNGRVRLLIHPGKTIPVVWGIRQSRLLLPEAVRQWSGEQLRSVLLHELAHIKRRDTVAQLLAQVACALHWFNPLVWFAAWRLGVERERACDDLVLASGVRASAYAGHLLDVVTGLSSAQWTPSCGLAMARKSSLEGRLIAVLSENPNRRGVSVALAAFALAVGIGIAVPIAMLRAADEKPGETPKTTKADTKPKDGETLKAGVEEKLKWGKPVNGLRAALVIYTFSEGPNTPDLYLLIQNVSDAPIRLNDTIGAPNDRYLTVHRDDLPQSRTKVEKPSQTDVMLKPREVTFVLAVPRSERSSRGQHLAAGMLKEPHMVLVGQMNIEKAPAGAWTGTLATAATNGAEAQIDPPQERKPSDVPTVPRDAKLDPAEEQTMQWGEPVNGLRAAAAIRFAPGERKPGELPDLYVAVQNVSNAPIRLNDSLAEKQPRMMYLKIDGRIVAGIGAKEPRLGDVTLQPGETTFVLMYSREKPLTDQRTTGGAHGRGHGQRHSPKHEHLSAY